MALAASATEAHSQPLDPFALADRLVSTIRSYGPVAVALSGGVDSAVVAKAAFLAHGPLAVAVTGQSASLAATELDAARDVAALIGIRHEVIPTNEFERPEYRANDGARCYFCKDTLYSNLGALRAQMGFAAICSGAQIDDLGDYRPGLVAAAEHGVRHPLQEAGFGKKETRALAAHWDLPCADKPAAPCLSSRIAVGVEATPERVARIEQGERLLADLGFREFRLRCHADELARIEVPIAEIARLAEPAIRERLAAELAAIGFKFVTLDLAGFRSGSLNVMVPAPLRASGGKSP